MAFKTSTIFNLKGIILQVLLVIPLIVSTNIDCNGKPFHCINSTHFMICVDLGGGVSSTIDNFVIPCPPTTVCQITNSFECEFAPTTPKLEVIPTNGAHYVEINGTTPLPDVITTTGVLRTTNGILFEDTFNTVSTIVTENEAVQFTTRQPGEIDTNPFENEKESEFMPVSTPYMESGLEISTTISDIKDIEVNISKESMNFISDKNSENIAIANSTYDNDKEPITENVLALHNSDIIPTESLVITTNSSHLDLFSLINTVHMPTEVISTITDISTTTDITTTNAASLKLESGGFQNKTIYYETNSDLPSTENVLFENNAITNGITTMLPAYEITTDRPISTENNFFAMKYNNIDKLTTTEMYHDTITTDNLSKNDSSIGNDTFIETSTINNEFIKNNEIIETGHVSTVDSIDITTTAFNDYYEIPQTTQLYYETITETLNPAAADVIIIENGQSDVLAVSNHPNIGTKIIPGYEALTNADAITTMTLIIENTEGIKDNEIIPSNSTEAVGITTTIGNIVMNDITSNSTETASVIFTAGSNINTNSNKYSDYTTESLELKNWSPSLKENVETNMSIMKLLKRETVTTMVTSEVQTSTDTLFSFKQNTTDSISMTEGATIELIQVNKTSSGTNSEILQNEFTTNPTITNSGVNNSTESLQELNLTPKDIYSTQRESLGVQETPITTATEVASPTTQSVLTLNKPGLTSTISQIKYELQNSTNIHNIINTDNVKEFEPIANEHPTKIITNDLSKTDLNKQSNGAPSLELSMSLFQDMMTESPVGQVKDNFSNKIIDRTTQLLNKENIQIVTPLFVIVQDDPEKNIMSRNTTNETNLILTEDSITTPTSYLETQSSQSNPMESLLLNNASKKYVNISVQPGKLTTPNVIDASYFVTPNTTKSLQVLLNKSEDSVTETILNDVQHNEPITLNEVNPLAKNLLSENIKRTDTATSSPNVDEINPVMRLFMNFNNKEDKNNNTVIYTTPTNNENIFQINNINVSSKVPASSDVYSKNGTIIQPSDFSLSTVLDTIGSIKKNINKSEQINIIGQTDLNQRQHILRVDPKIEYPTVGNLTEIIDPQKSKNLVFSVNNSDTLVTNEQYPKLVIDNPLDVVEGISHPRDHHPVSSQQSDLVTISPVILNKKTSQNIFLKSANDLSTTSESNIGKSQGSSEIKNITNFVSNNHLNKHKNTSFNGDSSLLPSNDSRSGFKNVSDIKVQILTTKDIAAESLPLVKYISDSNRSQESKQSLKVNATEIETKYNRTKTMNTTNIYFHETTDQINKTNFNCMNYSRGRYADKENCRKFYICVGKLHPIEGICPVDTVFSEIRKQCTNNLSQCIRNNQFLCTSEGRFGDFVLDNVYYICVKNGSNKNGSGNEHYIRFKLQCQNGYYLNKTSVKCIPKVTESNQSLTSNSENSNIYNSSNSATIRSMEIKQPSRNNFICEGEGKFADPNDCRKYYICYKNSKSVLKRKKKECDSDEVFDKDTKKCKDSESFQC